MCSFPNDLGKKILETMDNNKKLCDVDKYTPMCSDDENNMNDLSEDYGLDNKANIFTPEDGTHNIDASDDNILKDNTSGDSSSDDEPSGDNLSEDNIEIVENNSTLKSPSVRAHSPPSMISKSAFQPINYANMPPKLTSLPILTMSHSQQPQMVPETYCASSNDNCIRNVINKMDGNRKKCIIVENKIDGNQKKCTIVENKNIMAPMEVTKQIINKNSGNPNSGNPNSGNLNSGNPNSGNLNSGNPNDLHMPIINDKRGTCINIIPTKNISTSCISSKTCSGQLNRKKDNVNNNELCDNTQNGIANTTPTQIATIAQTAINQISLYKIPISTIYFGMSLIAIGIALHLYMRYTNKSVEKEKENE